MFRGSECRKPVLGGRATNPEAVEYAEVNLASFRKCDISGLKVERGGDGLEYVSSIGFPPSVYP